jgi:hypothetical protein
MNCGFFQAFHMTLKEGGGNTQVLTISLPVQVCRRAQHDMSGVFHSKTSPRGVTVATFKRAGVPEFFQALRNNSGKPVWKIPLL